MADMLLTREMKDKYGVDNLAQLRVKLNNETIDSLYELYKDRMAFLERSSQNIENTFQWIKGMSIVAYIIGIILIVVPLIYYIYYEKRIELLGLNVLGTGDILALLWYKPMQRIQNALGDYQQNMLILHSWSTQVGLLLYIMDASSIESVWNTCDRIHKITLEYLEAIQKYTESMLLAIEELKKAKAKLPSD